MKTKDFILCGILAVVYFVIMMIVSMVVTPIAGIFASLVHLAITPLITSIIPLLLVRRVPKFGVLTIYTVVWVTITALAKPILPWIITVLVCTLMADFIAFFHKYKKIWVLGLVFGVMALGQSLGYIITMRFLWDSYKQMFSSSMGEEWMQNYTELFYQNSILALFVIVPIVSSLVGTFLADKIYSKHFHKAEIQDSDTIQDS